MWRSSVWVSRLSPPRAGRANDLNALVDAAVQRLEVADPIAANKWMTGGLLTDPPRVRQVLDTVSADAQSAGISTDYVRTVFTDQINATEAIEYNRFADWKFSRAAALRRTGPGGVPVADRRTEQDDGR